MGTASVGLVMTVAAGLVVGFLAGLLAFRVKSRWCPECGATTVPLAERQDQMPPARPMSRRTANVSTRQPISTNKE